MKKLQQTIKTKVAEGKNLEQVKGGFPNDHARLVETVFNELKQTPRKP